ncbi:hypothetical protein HID58_002995 [Brassica napus]|uniref:Uncharacterized protein n=1 Tax=Brassica napus TaxID=3708 RepID=A0ABQ8ERL3_BRANA|nr:hypothetical protein HID58_002995 [Brassica napus]
MKASRESLTSIGSKRKVPRGPNNITSPPTPVIPPAFTKDIEIKRWVITPPPTPPAYVANFEMKRKVPRGPDNRTSPPTPVAVTEVLGGGRFYVQSNHLASMCVKNAPIIASFNPKRGPLIFILDNFWDRAMIMNAPRGAVEMINLKCSTSIMETKNTGACSALETFPYIKLPSLKEDFGPEEGKYIYTVTLGNGKDFNALIEEKYTYGTENTVTLMAVDHEISVNVAMLLVSLELLCFCSYLLRRKSLTSIGSKRLVPGGPDNATSPSNPPAFVTDIEIKRLVPGGPDNATSPSNPPAFVANIEMKRKVPGASRKSLTSIGSKRLVPGGPDNATSPSNPPAFVTDIEIKRLVPGGPDNATSPSNPPAFVANIEMKRKVPGASRKSLTSIGSKRLVPGGPDNATSPSNPPAFVTDIEIKRLVPGGPDNTTSPSNPPAFVANIEMKRKVPGGPNNQTSPPTPPSF